jgi:putative oxidoreductase
MDAGVKPGHDEERMRIMVRAGGRVTLSACGIRGNKSPLCVVLTNVTGRSRPRMETDASGRRKQGASMTMQSIDTHELITPSPRNFAGTDGLAVRFGDAFVLVGRVLLGWLFLASGWGALQNMAGFAGYLNSLKVPNPMFWAWIAVLTEVVFALGLILGIASRYAALLGFVYVGVATALAHRYWEYPAAQQVNQYNHFLKNLAVMGSMLFLFVTGAGRFSIDGWLRRRGR